MNRATRHLWLSLLFGLLVAAGIYLIDKVEGGKITISMHTDMAVYLAFLGGVLAIPFYYATLFPVTTLLDRMFRSSALLKLAVPTVLMMGVGYWLTGSYGEYNINEYGIRVETGLVVFGAIGLVIQVLERDLTRRYPVQGMRSERA
ncbi:hypothetical protein [Paenibacillus sp. 1P07SE]|uniref:hypothetical protein n=1 Tax=Paenibacillus sp. 1P07SE TaxID=3132209 RepID=UPI0039A53AC8